VNIEMAGTGVGLKNYTMNQQADHAEVITDGWSTFLMMAK